MIGSKQGWLDTGYVKNLNLSKNNLKKLRQKIQKLNFIL